MAEKTETRNRGCLKGCLTTFVIFSVIIIVGVIGIKMYFDKNIPEQVEFEASDIDSFYDKANIDKEDYDFTVEDLFGGNLVGEGKVEVDAVFTSEELTGLLQSKDGETAYSNQEDYVVERFNNLLTVPILATTDVKKSQVRGSFFLTEFNVKTVGENRLEVYANVSDNLEPVYELIPSLDSYRSVVDRGAGSIIYAQLEILHSTSSGFDIRMIEIRANGIPVPQRFIDAYQDDINRVINREVNNAEILQVHVFKIEEDGIHFVGILPEKLKRMDY